VIIFTADETLDKQASYVTPYILCTRRLAEMVTRLTRIREVLDSDFDWNTGFRERFFTVLPPYFLISTPVRPRLLPSTSFPIFHSPVILSFYAHRPSVICWVPVEKLIMRDAWPLKMGTIGCPETSVTTNLRCLTSQKKSEYSWSSLPCSQEPVRPTCPECDPDKSSLNPPILCI